MPKLAGFQLLFQDLLRVIAAVLHQLSQPAPIRFV
jgi:hypothetical protein